MKQFETQVSYQNLFVKTKEVYEALADDLSKELYVKRLVYNMTLTTDALNDFLTTAKTNAIRTYEKDIFMQYTPALEEKTFWHDDGVTPLVLYGAGIVGRNLFQANGLDKRNHVFFCDKNHETVKHYCGQKVISPNELIKNHPNAKVVICSAAFLDEMIEYLLSIHFPTENILLPLLETEFFAGEYFDSVLQFSHDEVFVDAGVYDGATSIEFTKRCKTYKKIYLFEPDEKNAALAKQNLSANQIESFCLFQKGLWYEESTLQFKANGTENSKISDMGDVEVPVCALDDVVKDKVTFIKMDIEGAELNALKGAAKTIQNHKPKLAICVYHKFEDILEIPLYLRTLYPGYRFYIRHYSNTDCDTILYAVP